jgi:hypothetical protein
MNQKTSHPSYLNHRMPNTSDIPPSFIIQPNIHTTASEYSFKVILLCIHQPSEQSSSINLPTFHLPVMPPFIHVIPPLIQQSSHQSYISHPTIRAGVTQLFFILAVAPICFLITNTHSASVINSSDSSHLLTSHPPSPLPYLLYVFVSKRSFHIIRGAVRTS